MVAHRLDGGDDAQTMDVDERLRQVARVAGLDLSAGVEQIISYSNDAWRIGDTVLRVCWRADRERLVREAALLRSLPEEVPHVEVLDEGRVEDLTWMLTRRVEGHVLSEVWEDLDVATRRDAFRQLALTLEALHSWEPPLALARLLSARSDQWLRLDAGNGRRLYEDQVDSILGTDVNPLPVARALVLLSAARGMDGVDPALVDSVGARLAELAPFDPFSDDKDQVLVHGDAHLGNVLWRDGRLVALLDFEWVRWGPADLELQPFCRTLEEGHPAEALPELAASYPRLTSHPHVVERLWLYDLAAVLRHLLVWPPGDPAESPPFHPLHRLPEMVKGSEYIEGLLGATCHARLNVTAPAMAGCLDAIGDGG